MARAPQVLAHGGDGICKGRQRFAIPHGLPDWQHVLWRHLSSHQRDHREQAQQGQSGTGNRLGIPRPLGLQTSMGTGLLPRHCQAPPEDKPLQDLDGVHRHVCAQHGLGVKLPVRVAHQQPADRQGGISE
jgi:hypothetical protein